VNAPETRIWRGVDASLFQFTTTALADLHIAIMSAFEQASVLVPSLNLDQTRAQLHLVGWDESLTDDALHTALNSLTGWQLLDATQDHAAHYATPEEFERKNLQWSLTRKGEAAMAGVLRSLDVMKSALGLQSATLDAIGDALADLASLAELDEPDTNGRIHIRLSELENHQRSLIETVRQFNGHLQRLVRADVTDDHVFADVKRRTVGYLQDYVDGVDRPQHRIALRIEDVHTAGLSTLFERALQGANLAPLAHEDPAPPWLAERSRRWQALLVWFAPADGSRPQIQQLIVVARSAIIELLRAIERRLDNRSRSTSVANDFRRLAELFESCPGDDEAHALFGAAFGLWSSRHAHKSPVDGTARRTSTSWLEAEPTDVEPSLRTTGSTATRGRAARVGDPSAMRRERQRHHAENLADQRQVQQALHTEGVVRLSTFTELDRHQFSELLRLLASALNTQPRSDGSFYSESPDGAVQVMLTRSPDDTRAVIQTDTGTFTAPNMVVSVSVKGRDVLGAIAPPTQEAVGG